MLYPDIIIPTCKSEFEIQPLLGELLSVCRHNEIITTCIKASAAVNRNAGLKEARSPIVVMMDDDISWFYPGWSEALIKPLIDHKDIIYVSARLLNPDKTVQVAMGAGTDIRTPILDVPIAPSACVAFRLNGIMFNEKYVGSGWKDTDYVRKLKRTFPHGRIVINNQVKLIHKNEMKNQLGVNYEINKAIYEKDEDCE